MTSGDAAEIWDVQSIPIRANGLTELIAVDVVLS